MVRLLAATVIRNLEGSMCILQQLKLEKPLFIFQWRLNQNCSPTTHIPLLPADGQVQVKEGQHSQALVLSTVLRKACHLLQLFHLLFGQHCKVTLLCHTGKRAHMDGWEPQVLLQTTEYKELNDHGIWNLDGHGLTVPAPQQKSFSGL